MTNSLDSADFLEAAMTSISPNKSCDLVMKGGLTSGVVYPSAVTEIAKNYRFHNIGGASAGAIAAMAAAAAEYRRQNSSNNSDMGGFEALGKIPADLGPNLQKLFQPYPALAPLFGILMTVIKTKNWKWPRFAMVLFYILRILWAYKYWTIFMAAMATAIFFIPALPGRMVFVIGIAVIIPIVVVWRIILDIMNELPKQNFGFCSGLTQKGHRLDALTPWLCNQIDKIAFGEAALSGKRVPLTVGDLKKHDIAVAAMTTDLSSGRPYQLPFQTDIHYYSRSEFSELFPSYIMDYLESKSRDAKYIQAGMPDDLRHFPSGDDMPVVMVARLSLSFPALISAIPLYRVDFKQTDEGTGKAPFVRCLFSDGGISSNFPIHFFDNILPNRPTFGISLGVFDKLRHGDDGKVELREKPHHPDSLFAQPITSLGGFLSSILNTAKDWQDSLQSRLPGYAERIVTIRLNPDEEGGMNLAMQPKQIQALERLGTMAGQQLVNKFNYNNHRYMRAFTAMPIMERALIDFAETYDKPATPEDPKWSSIIGDHVIIGPYNPHSAQDNSAAWRKNSFLKITEDIASLGRKLVDLRKKGKSLNDYPKMANIDAEIRVVASADRRSQKNRL